MPARTSAFALFLALVVEPLQDDLGLTPGFDYNLGQNYQLTDRHPLAAVHPFVKQEGWNVQLGSQFFPPDAFCHVAKNSLLVAFSHGRSRKDGPG